MPYTDAFPLPYHSILAWTSLRHMKWGPRKTSRRKRGRRVIMPSRTDDFIMVGSWAWLYSHNTHVHRRLSNISSLACCAAVVDGLACSASEISIQVTRRSDSLDLRASFSGKSKSGDFRRTLPWQGEERKKKKEWFSTFVVLGRRGRKIHTSSRQKTGRVVVSSRACHGETRRRGDDGEARME